MTSFTEVSATDDDYFDPDHTQQDLSAEKFYLSTEEILEEYSWASEHFRTAVREDDKHFWDGYMQAIERVCGSILPKN
jgi:hypothetical protein